MRLGLVVCIGSLAIGLAVTASAQQWLPWSNQPPMEGEVSPIIAGIPNPIPSGTQWTTTIWVRDKDTFRNQQTQSFEVFCVPFEGVEVIVVEITSGGYGSLVIGSYSDCKKTYTHLKTTIADMQEEEGATLIRYDRYRISDDSDANGGSIGNDQDFTLVQEVRIKNVKSQGGAGGGT